MRNFYTLIFAMLFVSSISAQGVRYVDEIFTDVTVTSDVTYAANVTVITTLQGLPPMALPQNMDVYTPTGDTDTNRPLIVYLHTGNFLPKYLNGGATGDRDDNCAVEICSRFARMGYVVASIDYRLGWNPLVTDQTERATQLIGAAYRGVQDARTAVRYFRMNEDVGGNTYGIDPTKVGYFGEGTGGYISYAASTISNYYDIILDDGGVPISKFWYDHDSDASTDQIPMVIDAVHGDPEAKYDGFLPTGVDEDGNPTYLQLCIGHYPDYSSDVSFSMNMGGAIGDLNWLDEGDVPMVSFQAPHDAFAPYTTGVLTVPGFNYPIISVSGAYDVHSEINAYTTSNNEIYQSAGLSDPLSLEALANGGFDGMFPVLNDYVDGAPTQPYDGSPWQWWNEADAQAYDAANDTEIWATQMTLNPNMGPTEANMWIDVIQGYTAPRLALAMGVVSAGPGCTDTAACNFNALATSDDGSCTYATPGYDCNGTSLNIEGCTDALACNYDEAATVDNTTCDYHVGTDIPTGATEVWLVGLTLTGTPYEALAGGCEMVGNLGVNPDVSINGVIVGDGTTPLSMAGISDPTGLLGELAALATTVQFSICGTSMTVAALGNNIPMVGNGTFWISPIPVAADATTGAGQYLWAAPMNNFTIGCGDPTACNFSGDPCELSLLCTYPGCMDATADNYNAAAGCDDGSCSTAGCTDPAAFNYNAAANTDDGSCIDVVNGCTDATASNYDNTANTDDGSCIILGCTYVAAENYNSLANDDDGSCTFAEGSDCLGDLDGDGVAATADLLLFLSVFGSTCSN
jgi:hypothetical protein